MYYQITAVNFQNIKRLNVNIGDKMKKLLILAVFLMISTGMVFAHGPDERSYREGNRRSWQQMDQWREVMHGISVTSENVTDGVLLKVTAESDEILQTLKTELKVNEKELTTYFKGVNVALTETEKGIDLNLTSGDKETVGKLQNWKNGLLFQYLRDRMHDGFDGRMGFRGQGNGGCGGWGPGYGPGMMQDNNGRMGYGPGMMQDDDGRMGYGQGRMQGNYGHMGYGSGRMGWGTDLSGNRDLQTL